MHTIEVTSCQSTWSVNKPALRRAVATVLRAEGPPQFDISVAIVDDPTIARLHQQFLRDPTPTDVLTFPLEQDAEHLAGEIVASADTAASVAQRIGWNAEDELLLYVLHGALHLVGYDDTTPVLRRRMRARERHYLLALGLKLPSRPRRRSADKPSPRRSQRSSHRAQGQRVRVRP